MFSFGLLVQHIIVQYCVPPLIRRLQTWHGVSLGPECVDSVGLPRMVPPTGLYFVRSEASLHSIAFKFHSAQLIHCTVMDALEGRMHHCVALHLHKTELLKLSVAAQFCLADYEHVREPFITRTHQRVGNTIVRLSLPYIYNRAGPGAHLTRADREYNAALSITYKAVCPYWREQLPFWRGPRHLRSLRRSHRRLRLWIHFPCTFPSFS